ncbi:MAG: hypothetical protein CVU56_19370 [Deltaproteobacteria bacterium HGW-Deltaproteobacteria-14]|nr:MAG: hypothetical protein CVU56_19370 [Deltaproteobacteria bacterium HGW-Deltaproteobacteria-14]
MRPDPRRDEGATTYRLCRLRHATLHPGATLWTPGVGGGNLGVGAAEALDDVGIGGELVVGFQIRAREPVHPQAVLARIEEVRPFPPEWDPEGLGAAQRYLLVGVARVELDRDTITHKRIPTVTGVALPPRDEELEPPTEALVAQLAALAAADNHWPQHWLDAFELLPNAPLGQWATSLGWRLSADERIALFDHPERIGPAVQSNLDSLQVGLDPTRRREAVRVQALTRRTTVMPDRTMRVTADAEGWALFHPADLSPDPDLAVVPTDITAHLALGDLVCVQEEVERAVRVRLTGGDLTEDEEPLRGQSVTFRLDVRHGRLFLGPGGLATGNQFDDKVEYADPAQWVDVPNGLFAAVVTAVGGGEGGERAYVVQLSEVDELATVPAPAAVPEL